MKTLQELRSAFAWRRWVMPLGAAAVIIALTAMLGWMLYEDRRTVRHAAIQSATNLAAALERDIERSIDLYDLSLQSVQDGMRLPEIDEYSPELRSLILFDRAAKARHLGPLRVFDPQGDTVASSATGADAASGGVTDQAFFRVHRDDPEAGLFVSGPVRNPWTGTYGVVLSRRLTRADGAFAGVVSGSIRLDLFRDLFASLKLGEGSTISLLRTDGILLLRMPMREQDIGRDMRSASLFQHFPRERTGVYEGVAQIDGERRLYVYTQIGELPLVLSIATSLRSMYADWRNKAALLLAATTLLDCTAFAILFSFMRELRQRTAAEAELARANSELAELATRDPLTGLANRRALTNMLRREWRRCTRQEEPLSLLVLDVDNFKSFNDLYGHGRGDECLQVVASAINASIRRPGDLAARYGGEEFVVVLPTTYIDGAYIVAETIRHAVIQQEVPHSGGPAGFVSVSVGVSCSMALTDPSIEMLIETADRALYEAKRGGRNRTMCPPGAGTPLTTREIV